MGGEEANKFTLLSRKESFKQADGSSAKIPPTKVTRPMHSKMPVIDFDDLEFQVDLPEPAHVCRVLGRLAPGQVTSPE
jgi:hypothetical protein